VAAAFAFQAAGISTGIRLKNALPFLNFKSPFFCHSAPVPLPLLPEKISYSIKLSINNYGRN
jgi:hypothetical protein